MDEIRTIDDIISLAKAGFNDWLRYGHVTVRKQGDLLIFNYNTMALFEGDWNFFERVSRGLIINHRTGEIVARAFDKFFNWGEGGRTSTAPLVHIVEKIDGSLGVLYRVDDEYRIATRGSFDGEQAEWATAFLQQHYTLTGLQNEFTLLFEIVYPDNRIVLDYGEREDLVLLAIRNRFTGDYLPYEVVRQTATDYGFSLPKVYAFEDLQSLIDNTLALDADVEGYVAEFADGQRFKFKSLRYLKLQKLILSLSFKNVLKAVEAGTIDTILKGVPDEFLDETRGWIAEIEATVQTVKHETQQIFDQAPKDTRKDFAMWVNKHHKSISSYLFAMMDGHDITPLIYQRHKWGHDETGEK